MITKKRLCSILLVGVTTTLPISVWANSARTFINASHLYSNDFSLNQLSALHFFADQNAGGTYDEFGFLNTDSSIGADFIDGESENVYTLYGELFVNQLILSAAHSKNDIDSSDASSDLSQLAIGYLLNENTIVRLRHTKFDGNDSLNEIVIEHNYQLNDNDYIGISGSVDTDIDIINISSSYYAHIGNGRYFRAGVDYQKDCQENSIGVNARYYFAPNRSVGGSFSEDEYSLSYQHYFSFNLSVGGTYIRDDNNNTDALQLSIAGQF